MPTKLLSEIVIFVVIRLVIIKRQIDGKTKLWCLKSIIIQALFVHINAVAIRL